MLYPLSYEGGESKSTCGLAASPDAPTRTDYSRWRRKAEFWTADL